MAKANHQSFHRLTLHRQPSLNPGLARRTRFPMALLMRGTILGDRSGVKSACHLRSMMMTMTWAKW